MLPAALLRVFTYSKYSQWRVLPLMLILVIFVIVIGVFSIEISHGIEFEMVSKINFWQTVTTNLQDLFTENDSEIP